MTQEHRDDLPWPCSCDNCCRRAAGAWHGYMDRVLDGELSLDEANVLMDAKSE